MALLCCGLPSKFLFVFEYFERYYPIFPYISSNTLCTCTQHPPTMLMCVTYTHVHIELYFELLIISVIYGVFGVFTHC